MHQIVLWNSTWTKHNVRTQVKDPLLISTSLSLIILAEINMRSRKKLRTISMNDWIKWGSHDSKIANDIQTSTYQVSQRCNCCWIGKDLPIEIKNLGTEWRLEKVIKDSFQGFICKTIEADRLLIPLLGSPV